MRDNGVTSEMSETSIVLHNLKIIVRHYKGLRFQHSLAVSWRINNFQKPDILENQIPHSARIIFLLINSCIRGTIKAHADSNILTYHYPKGIPARLYYLGQKLQEYLMVVRSVLKTASRV